MEYLNINWEHKIKKKTDNQNIELFLYTLMYHQKKMFYPYCILYNIHFSNIGFHVNEKKKSKSKLPHATNILHFFVPLKNVYYKWLSGEPRN